MALQTNTNIKPYYDDWQENDNYHRVMFKAGFPVQARELTQLQTILQDQIEKLGTRILKHGDAVQAGEKNLMNPMPYVRLSSITQGSTVDDFVGYYVKGVTSGVKAQVQLAAARTDTDDATFYVSYVDGGNTARYKTFLEGEILESTNPNNFTAVVGVNTISRPVTTAPLGDGVLFNVNEGSYFVNGFIVNVESQTIIVEKYDVKPTCLIGFLVDENLVNSNDETALLDNSQGSSNFAAPGADRLQINLTLIRQEKDVQSPNFIKLASLMQGNLEGLSSESNKWEWLYDILAKRTFDESGNYVTKDFSVRPMEYVNYDFSSITGLFEQAVDADGELIFDDNNNPLYPPIPPDNLREDLVIPDDFLSFEETKENYVLRVSPGEAYVQGYKATYETAVHLFGKKARNLKFLQNSITQITQGLNLVITNVCGAVDLQNISGDGSAVAFDEVITYRNYNDGYVGSSVDDDGKPLNRGNAPWSTYHVICDGEVGPTTFYSNEIYREGNSVVVAADTNLGLKRGDTIGGARILVSKQVRPAPSGVIRPRYFYPDGIIYSNDGYYGYNSTYRMGVLSSTFFTEIAVIPEVNVNRDWIVGDLVYGERSEAFGIVESGTTDSVLIVSNIVGRFLNDEVIYQGDRGTRKESRILREGDVIGFEFTDAGPNGNIFDLSGETVVTVSALGAELELRQDRGHIVCYDDRIELTQSGRDKLYEFPFPANSPFRSSRINYDVTTRNGVTGYGVVVPAKITNTLQKTKSFFSSLDEINNFSADISSQNALETDIFPVAQNSLFTGFAGDNYISCDNLSSDPSEELIYGDVITFVDDSGLEVNKLVHFVTKPIGYGSQRSQSRIYFTTTLNTNITGKSVERIRLKTAGSINDTLVYQLPTVVNNTLEKDPLSTGIDYQVYREFLVNVNNGTSTVTVTTGRPNEQFLSSDSNSSVSVVQNLTRPVDPNKIVGRFIGTRSYTKQDNSTTLIVNFIEPITDSCTLKIITPVQITNAKAKRKIYRENVLINVEAQEASQRIISLGFADCYNVKSVINADGIDIRDNYVFDDGQRDNFYDIGRLILKEGRPAADSRLTITMDYFEHDNLGDFFSVDSYTDQDGIGFNKIPVYIPKSGEPKNGSLVNFYELRDCIDFRPIVNATGGEPSVIASVTPGVDFQNSTNFKDVSKGGDAFVPRLPVSGSTFVCDLEYYLPQYNSLFLDKTGSLSLIEGVPSDEPTPPADISIGIRLYDIFLPAYTFSVKDIQIQKFNYKRYRMADIHSLEDRISRVEELVSLSLLEQNALNMSVRDAVTGLDRFKNGIIVDNFTDHSRGNVLDSQYRNSIDPDRGHLRPPHYTDSCMMEEMFQTDDERSALGAYFRSEANTVTVPYFTEEIVSSPFATRTVNLQPFSIFCYEGTIELDPPIDTFRDTNVLPEVVVENNQVYSALDGLTNTLNANNLLGTVWGDWVTQSENTTTSSSVAISTQTLRGDEARNFINAGNTPVNDIPENAAVRMQRDPGFAPPVRITTSTTMTNTTTETNQRRERFARQLSIGTGSVVNTSYGDRVVDVALAATMRIIAVRVYATRLKPNARFYAFFDGVDVSAWVSPDKMITREGTSRYRGAAGSHPAGFGKPLLSDDTGTFSGLFLIPNGRPPVEGYVFRGRLEDVQYQTSGTTKSFTTGTKTFRLNTDNRDRSDTTIVESLAETNFVSSGVIQDKQETIVSTRMPEFGAGTDKLLGSEERTLTSGGTSFSSDSITEFEEIDPVTINNITNITNQITQNIQNITNITNNITNINRVVRPRPRRRPRPRPRRRDPVAQSFLVDANYPDGVFVTDLDVYFSDKDPIHSVEAYLVTTDGQFPTENILPHSKVVLDSDSTLRVVCTLGPDVTSTTLTGGVSVIGQESGASGVVKSTVTFESAGSNPTSNVTNNVYYVTLDNYVNEFIPGEQIIPQENPESTSTFRIAPNEYDVSRIDLIAYGEGYTNVTVNFSDPELPGGVAATGEALVKDGRVYEVKMTDPGSGYVKVPSVTLDGDGRGAEATVRVTHGEKGVIMGVCTSSDGTAATKFRFHAPVYLLSDTYYAFVVKAPASLEYKIWVAKMGENMVNTETRVVEQASIGSMFRSQNGGLWSEDQTSDVKFILNRASFITDSVSAIQLQNKPLGKMPLMSNPFEFNHRGSNPNSEVFGENPQIVRITHIYHGFVKGDLASFENVVGDVNDSIHGVPVSELNGFHEVVDADLQTYTIKVTTPATSSGQGGGGNVQSTYNKPYEVMNLYTGLQSAATGSISSSARATEGGSVTGFNRENKYKLSKVETINPMESYYFSGPKVIASIPNQVKYNDTYHMNRQTSLVTTFYISTLSDHVSPVVDLTRTDAVLVRNLVDNPYLFGDLISYVSEIQVTNGGSGYTSRPTVNITGGGGTGAAATASISGGEVTSIQLDDGGSGYTSTPTVEIVGGDGQDATATAIVATSQTVNNIYGTRDATIQFSGDFDESTLGMSVGDLVKMTQDNSDKSVQVIDINPESKKIKIRGSNVNSVRENSVIDNQVLSGLSIERITKTEFQRYFVPEEKQNGSTYAKWISRLFVLENPCDGIEVKLSAIFYNNDDIRVYFKTKAVGSESDLDNENWIAFNGSGLCDNIDSVEDRSIELVDPGYIEGFDWKELKYSIQDLAKFDAVMIKIVMTAVNPAKVPLIDSMQVICSE